MSATVSDVPSETKKSFLLTSYVPTLAIKPAEMNGLEKLPEETKDLITPCILLGLWRGKKEISTAIKRVEKAFRNRYYILDVDPSFIENKSTSEELANLLDSSNFYNKWTRFVVGHEYIIPCLRMANQTVEDLLKQAEVFRQHSRPFCLRLPISTLPPAIYELVLNLASTGSDFFIILEGGWVKDVLTLQAQFSSIVARLVGQLKDTRIKVVCSCTSAVRDFSAIDKEIKKVKFNNRELIRNLQNASNEADIIYGDWGSTAPKEMRLRMNRPRARIDYPTKDSWIISRNEIKNYNYKEAVERLLDNPNWRYIEGLWGCEQILLTNDKEKLGVCTAPRCVAARVNIHLFIQANYNSSNFELADEAWRD